MFMNKTIKIFSGTILAILVLQLSIPSQRCFASSFSDVPVTHPMYDSITYLAERGFVSGYEDGTFKPDRVVTRAEILKFALKAANIEIINTGDNSFSDVPAEEWYYPYVLTASAKDIVGGYEDGTFQPNRVVTRAEGAKIILKSLNVKLPDKYNGGLTDVSSEDWFAPYVEYIREFGLMTIEGKEFKPNQGLKRQDVAEIIYHFVKAEEILKTPIWPIKPLLILVFIYALFWLLVWHLKRDVKNRWIYVLLAPMSIFYIIFKTFSFDIPSEKDDSLQIVSHRKQFAYFRTPRKLEREFIAWIDINTKPLFAMFTILLLWIVIVFIITTQINTITYKTPFTNLAETYVDTNK